MSEKNPAIWVVDTKPSEPSTRLVSAWKSGSALRHVTNQTTTVRKATPAEVIKLTKAGVELEDATAIAE